MSIVKDELAILKSHCRFQNVPHLSPASSSDSSHFKQSPKKLLNTIPISCAIVIFCKPKTEIELRGRA